MTKTLVTEARLYLREPLALFFPIFLPLMLLIGLGIIPGINEPDPNRGGIRAMDGYLPSMMVFLAVVTMAVTILPGALVTYREQGVLRRMSTTPASPARLLYAILMINVAICVAATVILIVVGGLVHDASPPRHLPGFLLVFALGTGAMLSIGLVLAAVINSSKVAQAFGGVAMFPMLFVAGMWLPRENMPGALQVIGDVFVVGPFAEALHTTWLGQAPQIHNVAIMAAAVVICGVLATKLFRWE
ncbi:ABC transporter permease [Sinosporangium siamense]|uniref:Transport permease protein n=1 Tax=Sinosporangium siamense TaxID=1367973 RepID=A0A919RPY0_9ACTN|nr:ABC transporter permease [Sinosporangium siamense]GII97122.1 transport permease protein [Sinosporangium siamense]